MLSLDGSSKANDVDFPCFVLTALDAYGKVRSLCYAFGESESHEIITFILRSYKEMAPMLAPSAVFTDGITLSSPNCITEVFPEAKPFLCCFHLFALDIPRNLRRLPAYEEVLKVCNQMRYARSENDFQVASEQLRVQFPAAFRFGTSSSLTVFITDSGMLDSAHVCG
jgi:hypothetical protein